MPKKTNAPAASQKVGRASSRAENPKPLYRRKPPKVASSRCDDRTAQRAIPATAGHPRSGRGVHAASATATQQVTRNSSHSNVRAVKRPEGRAPDTLHDTQLPLRTVATDAPIEAQPFLKWVGGKGQLLDQLDAFFPATVTRYFEPFVGGGAVFFHLQHRFPRLRAFLRDINPELINTYRAVRDRPRELMRRLDQHAAEFKANGDDYYYLVRSQHDLAGDEKKIVERAARMIFLNKTCFNGLWRVNARGEFNVPVGSYKSPGFTTKKTSGPPAGRWRACIWKCRTSAAPLARPGATISSTLTRRIIPFHPPPASPPTRRRNLAKANNANSTPALPARRAEACARCFPIPTPGSSATCMVTFKSTPSKRGEINEVVVIRRRDLFTE